MAWVLQNKRLAALLRGGFGGKGHVPCAKGHEQCIPGSWGPVNEAKHWGLSQSRGVCKPLPKLKAAPAGAGGRQCGRQWMPQWTVFKGKMCGQELYAGCCRLLHVALLLEAIWGCPLGGGQVMRILHCQCCSQ